MSSDLSNMPTLTSLLHRSDSTALVLPPSATDAGIQEISYDEFSSAIDDFRSQLDKLGLLQAQDAVSMSLINSAEFVVAFIAVGLHR